MKAGRLRERITLQTAVQTRDPDWGEEKPQWSDWKTVWAEALAISASEQVQAMANFSKRLCRFRVRYLTGINNRMRVLHKGQAYDIVSADPEGGRREYMVITAVQGMTDGQ